MKLSGVMLAGDHQFLLEAFRKLLEPHFDIVATATDGIALLEAAKAIRPDVVMIDMAMPLLNGLEAGRKLKQVLPQTKLIFLTMHKDPILASGNAGGSIRVPPKNMRCFGTLASSSGRDQR